MQPRLLLLALVFCMAAPAEMRMTVDQLVTFVSSAVQMKEQDKVVAEYLHRIKLSNKLEDEKLEQLQTIGVGPKTMQALRELRDSTATLAAPPPPAPKLVAIPRPSPDSMEQKRVLNDAREYALNYVKGLPDFICAQITRRSIDPSGRGYQLRDTIMEQLSYSEHQEKYKVVMVNNQPTDVAHEKLGGATSSGEFGTMMAEIFEPSTQTEFEWERWGTLRGNPQHVFSYRVSQGNSKYRITAGVGSPETQTIVTGYTGRVYVDKTNRSVTRITLDAENLPVGFPVNEVHVTLDYDDIAITDHHFILPLKAEVRSREGRFLVKNEVEFRLYRKFGADSDIKYDTTPDPLSDAKTKEATPTTKP